MGIVKNIISDIKGIVKYPKDTFSLSVKLRGPNYEKRKYIALFFNALFIFTESNISNFLDSDYPHHDEFHLTALCGILTCSVFFIYYEIKLKSQTVDYLSDVANYKGQLSTYTSVMEKINIPEAINTLEIFNSFRNAIKSNIINLFNSISSITKGKNIRISVYLYKKDTDFFKLISRYSNIRKLCESKINGEENYDMNIGVIGKCWRSADKTYYKLFDMWGSTRFYDQQKELGMTKGKLTNKNMKSIEYYCIKISDISSVTDIGMLVLESEQKIDFLNNLELIKENYSIIENDLVVHLNQLADSNYFVNLKKEAYYE